MLLASSISAYLAEASIAHDDRKRFTRYLATTILLGIVFCAVFRIAAKNATAGVPGALQNAVEMIVDFIDDTVRSIFTHKNDIIAPMALTRPFSTLLSNEPLHDDRHWRVVSRGDGVDSPTSNRRGGTRTSFRTTRKIRSLCKTRRCSCSFPGRTMLNCPPG